MKHKRKRLMAAFIKKYFRKHKKIKADNFQEWLDKSAEESAKFIRLAAHALLYEKGDKKA